MKRWTIALLLCMALLLGCVQSGDRIEKTNAKDASMLTYTNLNTPEEREQLRALLQSAGVLETRIDALLAEIEAFNASVPEAMLTQGWESSARVDARYDPYEMQEAYEKQNPTFVGYNCRLTAFSILADRIAANDAETPSVALFLDREALDQNPTAAPTEAERNKFFALFAEMPTGSSAQTEAHVASVQAEWARRGVTFLPGNAHLITVVFHDRPSETESELFFGHAGVLIEQADAVYFLEKIAFMEPYCLTRFADRVALNDYLMAKYDISEGQPTAPPFLMEDGALLAGYRPNPNKAKP